MNYAYLNMLCVFKHTVYNAFKCLLKRTTSVAQHHTEVLINDWKTMPPHLIGDGVHALTTLTTEPHLQTPLCGFKQCLLCMWQIVQQPN